MKIFALETNIDRVKEHFLAPGENEIFLARPHVLLFIFRSIPKIILTAIILFVGFYAVQIGLFTTQISILFLFILWFFFVFYGWVEAFIDWRYDFIFLTTDKLIIVDQMSLFRKSITPISIENLGDVQSHTQWLNLFNFGIIRFALKEGQGPEIVLSFMPNADRLVAKISEQTTLYQRRKDFVVPYRQNNAD